MKLGLIVQITSEGQGSEAFSINKNEDWAQYARDVRSFIKVFPGRKELQESGRDPMLSFDESEKSTVFLRFLGRLGYFICLVKARPEGSGRPYDNTAAWIFIPSGLVLSNRDSLNLIDGVEDAISGRLGIDTAALTQLFSTDYGTNGIIPASSSIASQGEGIAARYYGSGTDYQEYELLGNGIAQPDYSNFEAIFLLKKGENFYFSGKVLSGALKETTIVYPPQINKEFRAFFANGAEFTNPVEVPVGSRLGVIWKRNGYLDIQKECFVRQNSGQTFPRELMFNDNDIMIGIYREWFHITCEGKEVSNIELSVENETLKDNPVWVPAAKLATGVYVVVSGHGFEDFKQKIRITSAKIEIKLRRVVHQYIFSIPLYDGDKYQGKGIIKFNSNSAIKDSPIQGYQLQDGRVHENGYENELEYSNFGASLKHFAYGFISCIALLLAIAVYQTWDEWELCWGFPPFKATEQTHVVAQDDQSEDVVNPDSIRAIDYLENNETWKQDSLEANPFTQGLYDALNTYQADKLEGTWNSRLGSSHKFLDILNAIHDCKNRAVSLPAGEYSIDKTITIDKYINKLSSFQEKKVEESAGIDEEVSKIIEETPKPKENVSPSNVNHIKSSPNKPKRRDANPRIPSSDKTNQYSSSGTHRGSITRN